jgi:hypothetical protein
MHFLLGFQSCQWNNFSQSSNKAACDLLKTNRIAKGHRPTLYLAAKASISIVNYNQETKQSLKSIQFLSSILHALFHM